MSGAAVTENQAVEVVKVVNVIEGNFINR